jgi:hypothetical protein
MQLVSLDAALNKRPFRPFEIRVDGEVIRVSHPEQILFDHSKTTLVVADQQDHIHIFDVEQVSKVCLLPRRSAKPPPTGPQRSG